MSKNKIAIAISLFLMLTMTLSLVVLPTANAHTPPWTIPTYSFISVEPNPVGVGQTAYVNFWIDKVPPTAVFNYGYQWHGMTVTVTKPDGHTVTLNMGDSDAAGGTWNSIVVDQEGIWEFEGNFPEQTAKIENPYPYSQANIIGLDFINDTYTGSSATTTLVVQTQPIETAYPSNPLPTELWTRPINSMNRDWYTIGGNWLGLRATSFGQTGYYDQNGNFNPYTEAPGSAHVLWTKPEAFGGQLGGEFGASETSLYSTGTAYEAKFDGVVLYGILYYTQFPGAGNNMGPLTAVDIRTGKTLWTVNASNPLRCGMIVKFDTGDQYGGHAYVFTSPGRIGLTSGITPPLWSMYDAMTGQWLLDIANASEGTLVRGQNGELLSYRASGGMLSLWNMSKCIAAGQQKYYYEQPGVSASYSPAEIWRPPQGHTLDWNDGYEWSVPVEPGLGISAIDSDVVLMTAQDTSTPGRSQTGYRVDAGYSAVDGHKLWGPINRTLTPFTNKPLGPAGDGVFTEFTNQDMTWTAYNIATGQVLWGPIKSFNSSWAYYDFSPKAVIGYGNLYTWGLAGEAYAFDVQTGDLVWSWNAGSAGVDTPYGVWPLGVFGQYVLADGKLYLTAGHDYTPPVFKGAKMYCLNATTGELIWDSLCFSITSCPACADGVLVKLNGYDNQIYGYGKGPSATTVTASPKVSVEGGSVLVEGLVTDISPGTEEYLQTARFPNGVPAISDEDQSAWMEYLYQQQPKPVDATGVKVTVTVLDPNGNCYDVGTTTSTIDGFFKLAFTPLVPGEYYVYATFAGSESYYSSSAVTAINVEEAPAAAQSTPMPASMTDTYVLSFGIASVIAIIAIGLVLILMLRKR